MRLTSRARRRRFPYVAFTIAVVAAMGVDTSPDAVRRAGAALSARSSLR